MELLDEIWEDIPEYEGLYQISNFGRVKSIKRTIDVFRKNKLHEKNINDLFLTPSKRGSGYYCVTLSKNNQRRKINIHKLMALTFWNHKTNDNNYVVDHINNDKTDNRLSNLQLITHRHNSSKDRKNKTSAYTGVYWDKFAKKWKASIMINKKVKHIGNFICEHEAAKAYQRELTNTLRLHYNH